MGKRDKRVAFVNPIAMARARGPAPTSGPTIRDYLGRDRPTLEEAREKMTSMKKTGSDALAAWEEQMNDKFREELRHQREERLGGRTSKKKHKKEKKRLKKKRSRVRSRSRSRSPSPSRDKRRRHKKSRREHKHKKHSHRRHHDDPSSSSSESEPNDREELMETERTSKELDVSSPPLANSPRPSPQSSAPVDDPQPQEDLPQENSTYNE